MKKYVISILMVLALLIGLVGCSSEVPAEEVSSSQEATIKDSSQEKVSIDAYNIGFGGDWGYPAPYTIFPRGPGFVFMQYTFDSLIWRNEAGDLIPQLAEEWAYDEATMTYTFTLHEGIKWHDGQALTAEDVVFTVNYMQEHKLPWLDLSMIKEAKAIDDRQVTISLKNHYAPFYNMVGTGMTVLPEHIYSGIDNPMDEANMDVCIGSGPYVIKSYSPEEGRYVFEAFDDYYGGDVRVKRLNFLAYSPEMQISALIRGEVDMIMPESDAMVEIVAAGFKTTKSMGMVTKLMYNSNKAPFDQKAFRQAIAYAIDTNQVISIGQRGHAFKAQAGLIPMTSPYYYEGAKDYNQDLAQVDAHMTGLGYEKIDGYYALDGQILEMELLGHDRIKRDIDVIAAQLDAAGFKTKVVFKDLATSDQYLREGNYDISITEDGAFADPMYFNRMIFSDVTDGFREENSDLVMAIKKQVGAKNFEERKAILEDVQVLYAESLPSYALYFGQMNAAYNDKVDVYFTEEGYGVGVTLPFNKLMYIE